jgi:energy-coupling factor transport system ATP-binding protein
MAFIELKNVTFTYPDAKNHAINNLSLNIEKGQFVVLFGASGSGKSTLLSLLKKEIQPNGELSGEILVNEQSIQDGVGLANKIGFVFQDPENQVVAENVLHELVFGLESMGLPTNEMRSRVAELVHFFGTESLLDRKTQELSGGKKQQLNLASVLLMQPDILLLDEPNSQLDPVSARELLDLLVRLNDEFGMTIILTEHRLEEFFAMADKIVMMEKGQIILEGAPREVIESIWHSANHAYVPTIPSLYLHVEKEECNSVLPITVKEGKKWIGSRTHFDIHHDRRDQTMKAKEILIHAKKITYRYNKETDFVLKELDFSLPKGEIYALLGGNGSGKSTLLKVLSGIYQAQQGQVTFQGKPLSAKRNHEFTKKIGYLPQNPKMFFLHDSIEKEMNATMRQWGITDLSGVETILNQLGISHLRESHPYDVSGGELQKAALACLLLRKPELLILDEPTKGLDPISKQNLATILDHLKNEGITIVMATHDIEFAAQYASICGMMFQGKITTEGTPKQFFKGNFFYTTMIQRLFRHIPNNDIITLEEAVRSCASIEHLA